MNLRKQLLHKVGMAIQAFDMIRAGDRIAVGVSGGKDSLALLDALAALQKRSPVRFELQAFTVEQGKFVRPIDVLEDHLAERGVRWTYYRDQPSLRLIEEQPDHGCDLCSRYRRRAVYEIAASLGANVVALGHTADDFCESLLRNTLYTGRLAALPPIAHSRTGEYRVIRPLVYVWEELTTAYCGAEAIPITPCVCSFKSGTVRESIRTFLATAKESNPHVMENMLSAMSRIDQSRLLDRRFFSDSEGQPDPDWGRLPVCAQETV